MNKLILSLLFGLLCIYKCTASDDAEWLKDGEVKAFPCPNEDDIYPCFCEYVDDRLSLDCSNVTSDAQLANVFLQDFPQKTFYEFKVSYNEYLQNLYMDTNGVEFERILFYPGPFKITQVSEAFLAYSRDTLEDFAIQNSPLTNEGFPFTYVDKLPHIHRLYIEASQLTYVPKLNSTTIRDLRLSVSNISELAPDTFDNEFFLYNLDLQYNDISRLEVNVFPIYFETVRIRLDFNKISNIQRRAFYDASINGSAGLSFLYLNNNEIPQLNIETIPLTKTSRVIHLENNKIKAIASPSSFYFLSEPKLHNVQILMANNELTTLQENKWIPIMKYISVLDLKNNPLECGCDIAWLVLNTAYFSKISAETTCYDGTYVQDLDPNTFLELC